MNPITIISSQKDYRMSMPEGGINPVARLQMTHRVLHFVAARILKFGFIAALLHIIGSFQNWNSFFRTGFVQPTQHEKTEAFRVDEVLWKRRETVGASMIGFE